MLNRESGCMKKILFLSIFIIINILSVDKVSAANHLTRGVSDYSNLDQTVTYYNSNIQVEIPEYIKHNKQEFRGVYVYTKNNIDFNEVATINEFKTQFDTILNKMDSYNMNSIIFQVRPMNDAFYSSKLNPWSRYLMGEEGKSLDWDPLTWMIDESHKRGISFHAGFNTFQVSDYIGISKEEYLKKLD